MDGPVFHDVRPGAPGRMAPARTQFAGEIAFGDQDESHTPPVDGAPGAIGGSPHIPGRTRTPGIHLTAHGSCNTSEQGGISDEEPIVQEVTFGPQMYGELFAYRVSDGLIVRVTHNKWEKGNPSGSALPVRSDLID